MYANDTIKLPLNLSLEELGEALYPEVTFDAGLFSTYQQMFKMRRAMHSLSPCKGVSQEALQKQFAAVELMYDKLYQRACRLYFATPGWTRKYLERALPGVVAQYFMVRGLQSTDTADSYYMGYDNQSLWGSVPKPTGNCDFKAFAFTSEEEPVKLYYIDGKDHYEGRPSDLLAWARDNCILMQRVPMAAAS